MNNFRINPNQLNFNNNDDIEFDNEHVEFNLRTYIKYTTDTYNYYEYILDEELFESKFQKYMMKFYIKIHKHKFTHELTFDITA